MPKRERSVRADDSVNHMLSFAVNRMFYENTGDCSLSLQGQMNQQNNDMRKRIENERRKAHQRRLAGRIRYGT